MIQGEKFEVGKIYKVLVGANSQWVGAIVKVISIINSQTVYGDVLNPEKLSNFSSYKDRVLSWTLIPSKPHIWEEQKEQEVNKSTDSIIPTKKNTVQDTYKSLMQKALEEDGCIACKTCKIAASTTRQGLCMNCYKTTGIIYSKDRDKPVLPIKIIWQPSQIDSDIPDA